MTKLTVFSIHRRSGSFFILTIVLLSIIYLIMVSTIFPRVDVKFNKPQLVSEYPDFENSYGLHKRDINNTIISSHKLKSHVQEKEEKLILLWSPLFEGWNFLQEGKHSFSNSGCLETRCEVTSDRKRLLQSDAVLFHIRTLSMFDLPENRMYNQKWVFFSLEAPPYSRFQGFDFMNGMFNWTMTYRRDSDIYIPYGRIVSSVVNNYNHADMFLKWKEKSGMAVWMVSHCQTAGNREKYIDQLKKFMDVDVYGSCGHFGTCPFNKTNLCIKNFSKQYYFFFAFENAVCDDYVTEKLFRTLQYDMIPVVFGGSNYTATAPPHSFIDALKFSSPKKLSSHLLHVASNFTLFSSYFKWRMNGYSDDTPNHCELCQKLHSEDLNRNSVYPDINDWWINKSHCKKWRSGSTVE